MSEREVWSLSLAQCDALLQAVRNERARLERVAERTGAQLTPQDRQRDQILKQILGLYGGKSYARH